jgi:hypothetical protein
MQHLNYTRLKEISTNVKPFRGSTNRFPIGSRTHNTKVFFVDELDGETVFRICYGSTYDEIPETKQRYVDTTALGLTTISEITWREEDDPLRYVRYVSKPREMGIVRPDNTFEFTANHYGQGDNTIMSAWSRGYFFRSSRHGGMVYKLRWNGSHLFHPIFKGMRVNCETMESQTKYQVTGKRVMRKVAKDFLKQYVDFYKVSEAMMKAMKPEDFVGIGADLVEELKIEKSSWGTLSIHRGDMHKEAQNRLQTAPLDSAVLYCLAHDVMHMERRVSYYGKDNYWANAPLELMSMFDAMKRRLNTEIFRNNPEVMKPIEYEMGKEYPASQWGVTIVVDGKEVEQY